jgi:nitroimidazol reductase NimA-like FMN-containing flavoprotein (pyridoxamine 5'-phosphate oxidase superfamily)
MNEATARQILKDIQYATLATVSSTGNPWNTPVFYAYDSDGCIYWSSHPQSVHSQNIAQTGKVFIVIYNSKASEGEGVGVYIDAAVEMIENVSEIEDALKLLSERSGNPFEHPEKFVENDSQRLYKATPKSCWINDARKDKDGDFIEDYRVAVNLSGIITV